VTATARGVEEVERHTERKLTPSEFLTPILVGTTLLALPLFLFVPVAVERSNSVAPLPTALFAIALVYTVARLTTLLWRAEPEWMAIGFWVFSYAWIAVAGLIQTIANANPIGITLSVSVATRQAGLVLLGLLAYDLAYNMRRRTDNKLLALELSALKVKSLAVLAILLGPFFVFSLGGFGVLFSSREAVNQQLTAAGLYTSASNATGGALATFANCLPFVALLCTVRLLFSDLKERKRPLPWVLLVLLVAENLLLNNPVSNARYWFFAVVLALWYVMPLARRPAVLSAYVLLFAVAALTVFPFLDKYRIEDSTAQRLNITRNSYVESADYLLGKTDYGSVTDIGLAIKLVDESGLTWGQQLAGAGLFWVPRTIWPDKPDNTAFLLADASGFDNRNIDSPLWAEGYVDFYWVGTAAVLAFAGYLSRGLDQSYISALRSKFQANSVVLALVPVLAGYEFIVIRGSLLQAMLRLVAVTGLVMIVCVRPATSTMSAGPLETSSRQKLESR
jgi:hypothetical protein